MRCLCVSFDIKNRKNSWQRSGRASSIMLRRRYIARVYLKDFGAFLYIL